MYYGAAYPEGLFACSLAVTYQHEHPLVCERPIALVGCLQIAPRAVEEGRNDGAWSYVPLRLGCSCHPRLESRTPV